MYSLLMTLRNWYFDHGWLEQRHANMPVVSVGNLAVGGTGKTPMVELIVEELRKRGHQPAVVSRGYGRRTRGPIMASPSSTANELGDEPLQIYRKMQCPVVVSEDRRKALPLIDQWNAEHTESPITILVLDDAYQHRYLWRDYNILLTDYHSLYTRDRVLPLGRLREAQRGAQRAHCVVVTKCPADLSEAEQSDIRKELNLNEKQELHFASIAYEPLPNEVTEATEGVTLVTGIANPKPLLEHLEQQGIHIKQHLAYPDHHRFSADEIEHIAQTKGIVLTTEKDSVRLPQLSHIHTIKIHTLILK